MAIEEHDREDLLRDGRAMSVRGELVSDDEELLIGFRPGNQASLYCGPERVFQFDSLGRLRRVYLDGQKFAADDGRLVEICRETRGGRVELTRHMVENVTSSTIVDVADRTVKQIAVMIDDDQAWRVIGAGEAEFRELVRGWAYSVSSPPQISAAAGA